LGVQRGRPLHEQIAAALRNDIRSGKYAEGDQLPSERELREQHDVSVNTVRAAIVQLRAEGLVESRQGRGVFVLKPKGLRRLSDDIVRAEGFYTMVSRQGEKPTTKTEVRREPATEEVAEALGVELGAEVVVRARLMGTEEHPLVSQATSYFPTWVVERAPNLADPTISGLPKWLREAFGDTYSDDLIDARMPTEEERKRLEIPENTPVIILKGTTRASDHRVLHFIDKVTVAGRLTYSYRFGVVPES
jgi:GntR family transcriptional regulator